MERISGVCTAAALGLTSGLLTVLKYPLAANTVYAFEFFGVLNTVATGNVTTRVSVDDGSATFTFSQLLNTASGVANLVSAAGAGAQSLLQTVTTTGARAVTAKGTVVSTKPCNLVIEIAYTAASGTLAYPASLLVDRLLSPTT